VLLSLVEALSRRGWQSRVVLPEEDWLHARLLESGEDAVVLESNRTADIRFLSRLLSEIRLFRPRLLHAHLLGAGVYGSLAARMSAGIPVVTTFHGSVDVDSTDRLLWLKRRLLRRSRNRIVYVSQDLRGHLEPLLSVPPALGRVIYNGVVHVDRAASSGLRAELGLRPQHVIVGAVGNLRPAKDYPNLLRAAGMACAQNPELRFVVLGGGPDHAMRALVELRQELGLVGIVHLMGFRDDVAELMSGFDLFVSSSSSEGLPLSSLQAMGMGLPAVLTACGGPSEIVRHGETGVLVPPGNPWALAQGVLQLAADREYARRLGELGRTDVRRRFSAESMVDQYVSLYDEVLGV
jgi:glycosyltransferase involved in cell wall biosynthesis